MGGRTFKNITAFEYALWVKDFKMIEMMLGCIPPKREGDAIRAALYQQYQKVIAPTDTGGGLRYSHTYKRSNLDESGIPDGTTTLVTKVRTDNHFDMSPLLNAYKNYNDHYDERDQHQRARCWTGLIGKHQCLLPVHILQRFCDPETFFHPPPQFKGQFNRRTDYIYRPDIMQR